MVVLLLHIAYQVICQVIKAELISKSLIIMAMKYFILMKSQCNSTKNNCELKSLRMMITYSIKKLFLLSLWKSELAKIIKITGE